ncbi:peptidase S10 [Chelativorans sp.]|uniref:S10 family peptidase n=1 Tax=Chelativorans sp. TaxID=2203393 RepID=UPI00281110AE|nr:peptidase S10 [Chelativorans sp.]
MYSALYSSSAPEQSGARAGRRHPQRGVPQRKRLLLAVLLVWLLPMHPVLAQRDQSAEANPPAQASRLPEPRKTLHRIQVNGAEFRFEATAGAITLTNSEGQAEAEIAFVSYVGESADRASRPVTFAVNGGPGAASAYLHLGAIGPWLLPMDGDRIVPSQSIALVDNPETWLQFTDLVFIDPAGTGFSRLIDPSDRLRGRYFSIDGDIDALARFVTRWLTENGRLPSPKYFVGESYGGFRGPLLAEELQTEYGVALKGLILVSPVLDFGWWSEAGRSPLRFASLLPSLAATSMERRGAFSEDALDAAEGYAAGEYVTDLLLGFQDESAIGRIVTRVAELTGLPAATVRDYEGRVDAAAFEQELALKEGRIASIYDGTVTAEAPASPNARRSLDPVLSAMTAPLTSAMLHHYRNVLQWLPQRRYLLLNRLGWNWGQGREPPEAISALSRVLALDPEFRVLVVHGYTDLVTPYFGTELLLRQVRPFAPAGRLRQENYRGGHMFYTRPDSRRALRDDALLLYGLE